MGKSSQSRIKANAKYNKKAYDRIEVTVKKGEHQTIKEYAIKRYGSVNKFINTIVKEAMERDGIVISTENNEQKA